MSEIFNLISNFKRQGYYLIGDVSEVKLNNAIDQYKIPSKEEIYAIIDSTVFGSAKNGLEIFSVGVYWKNDWATKSRKTKLNK